MAQPKGTPKPKAAKSKSEKPEQKTTAQKTDSKTQKPDELPETKHYCSFCGEQAAETRQLIAGPYNIFICEECAEICVRIFSTISPTKWIEILTDIIADRQNNKKQPKAAASKKGEET